MEDGSGTDHDEQIAVRAIDIVNEFGECRIKRVADTDVLRRAIRREARRRKVKICSRAVREDFVMVVAEEQSVAARAYGAVTLSLVVDGLDAELRGEEPEDLIDISVRVIDAGK
jgi:hypothetical protein